MTAPKSPLLPQVTCPHCWHEFPPHEVRWVAAHQDLIDKNNGNRPRRFLPSHFTAAGFAVDPLGEVCKDIACPECQLTIARDLLELPSTFLSILGAPASGKSYFLASAIWQLRKTLNQRFQVGLADSDPGANRKLLEYEEILFNSLNPDQLVALPKTELQGDLYQKAMIRNQVVLYARPFVFRLRLQPQHRHAAQSEKYAKTLCLYDNAGENFLPDVDSATQPGARHLSVSKALLFLFDPTQHHAFRRACAGNTDDPQMLGHADQSGVKTFVRQDQVLNVANSIISGSTTRSQKKKDSRPLIVVVTKFDAWKSLTGGKDLIPNYLTPNTNRGMSVLHIPNLQTISEQIKKVLVDNGAQEIVTAANDLSTDVTYLPVSALGTSPVLGPVDETGKRPLMIRPRDIKPQWIEIPLLYAIHRAIPGLIPAFES